MTRPNQAIIAVGGLLPQDLLERVAAADSRLPAISPGSYHFDSANALNQAINRSWVALCGAWASFKTLVDRLPAEDRATTTTRERFLLPLFQELGYGRLRTATAIEGEGRSFAISHGWGNVPIHLVGCRLELDRALKGERGAATSSPHGLMQDLLNHSDAHLWGFVSNGLELRLLRDHHRLTRQAYVSFDLEGIFEGEQFASFRLLFLLCHQSRVEADKPVDFALEQWFAHARDEGVRALDKLRDGVEAAIVALGGGFLTHRANEILRARLRSGELSTQDYFRQLLRLVYRFIFLFVAEDRDALLDPHASAEARERFNTLYATARLRRLAEKRRGGPHGDGWVALSLLMDRLGRGCPELALPALGSFLWRSEAAPDLVGCALSNESLFSALRSLCHLQDGNVRRPVSWSAMESDELGSVYEALMERVPRVNLASGTFVLDTAAGNERKTTGSYYTPTSLVDCLLDTALDPVLEEAARKPLPEKAILGLKVVDPACGSGHFLVAAARRIARRLAQVRTGGEEPSPRDLAHALRDVVGRCIYGVDLNPMAVELCKVSLWMEAIEPGRPLSFLESHIRHGNALFGATPELMDKGIPDEAWELLTGDDKDVQKALKKRNRQERAGQTSLFGLFAEEAHVDYGSVEQRVGALEVRPDDTFGALEEKEVAWSGIQDSQDYRNAHFVADAWCAAFVWPKTLAMQQNAPTEDAFRRIKREPDRVHEEMSAEVERLARQYQFFHWHLAFPQVFAKGGFDVVLGNPPWERVKLQEQEFFATKSEVISKAVNAAARKKLIAALPETDAPLWRAWCDASREAEGQSHFVRQGARFPLCGKGDVNTYALFAELNRSLVGPKGRAGFIVPTGIATDDTTKEYFGTLVEGRELASFYSFENEEFVFPAVHHAFKFALLTVDGSKRSSNSDLVFFARQVTALADPDRHFSLTPAEFVLLNPNTKTCPTFRSKRDAEINKAIYRRGGVLQREGVADGDPWGVRFMAMLHMANDSGLFRTRTQLEADGWTLKGNIFTREGVRYLPLLEAKMVHHFDHRFGTYEGQSEAQSNQGKLPEFDDEAHADADRLTLPAYWVPEIEASARLEKRWDRKWFLGWRDICRSTDQRTVIASMVRESGTGDTFLLMIPSAMTGALAACTYANLASFVLDYTARQKVGGTHLKYHTFKQLPILPPTAYDNPCPWHPNLPLRDWLLPRVLELTYTAWDLAPFAHDCGYDGPPFRWDPARRFLLRCELDAAFFHLYGISHDDADYILDTFPIVRRNDEKAHGEYRTKRVILEILEELAATMAGTSVYRSRLDPVPGDPASAHEQVNGQLSPSRGG